MLDRVTRCWAQRMEKPCCETSAPRITTSAKDGPLQKRLKAIRREYQEQVAAEAVVAASTPRIYGSLNPKMMSSNSNLRICATAGLTFAGHDPSLFRRQDPARIGEAPMIDADSVRRATMLLQRAQQLTAAAHRAANRSYLLSLAETYRTAAEELAPGTPDPATELFSTSGVKPTQ